MLKVQEQIVNYFDIGIEASMVLNLVDSLVNNSEDLEEVLSESFKSNENRAFFVLNKIHKRRLRDNMISKERFLQTFYQDRKKALEELFIAKFHQWHIDELEDYNITPEQLYDLHKDNLEKPFFSLLRDNKHVLENRKGASIRHKWESSNGKYIVSGNIYPKEIIASIFIRVKGKRSKLNYYNLTENERKKIPKYVIKQCEQIKAELENKNK